MSRLTVLFPLLLVLAGCEPEPASAASNFPSPPSEAPIQGLQTAVFAGGCFWGVEAIFERLQGVTDVVSGYSGGTLRDPTYDDVSTGQTGYAESVEVTYDPSIVSYGTLLKVFFSVAHDPTQLNYQGPDHGTQYRSALFVKTAAQRATAEAYLKTLSAAKVWKDPIVTEVTEFTSFWAAEPEHQDFIVNNPRQPYIVRFDLPKIRDLEKRWPELLKKTGQVKASWHGMPVVGPTDTIAYPVKKTEQEWKAQLKGLSYAVLREEATERAFTGALNNEHRKGTYYSAATGLPLFRSEDKFDSGTGWPSFTKPITPDAVFLRLQGDREYQYAEVEDTSGSHLGHVFDDGPAPTGLRYCMNSVALTFVPD